MILIRLSKSSRGIYRIPTKVSLDLVIFILENWFSNKKFILIQRYFMERIRIQVVLI